MLFPFSWERISSAAFVIYSKLLPRALKSCGIEDCGLSAISLISFRISPTSPVGRISGTSVDLPLSQSSSLSKPLPSVIFCIFDLIFLAINKSLALRTFGAIVDLGSKICSELLEIFSSFSISGHGASGLTWSIVTGDIPPKSSMPDFVRQDKCFWFKFGGTWIDIWLLKIFLAITIVHCSSSKLGSGKSDIKVFFFGLKFWMITSCIFPYLLWISFMTIKDWILSSLDSPIPIKSPVVNGICCSPALINVCNLYSGSLSGEPKCGIPFSDNLAEWVSNIRPIDPETSFSSKISSGVRVPTFKWGINELLSRICSAVFLT